MPGAKKKPRSHFKRYSPEFREQMVALMRAGRVPTQLSKEFGVSVSTLTSWMWRARIEAGEEEGLTQNERAELAELRRENARLREEREILKKFAAWSAQESNWTLKKRSGS
jgi:transposase